MDASLFRFALGQRVILPRPEAEVWIVYVRMLLEDARGLIVEYGLRPEDRPEVRHEFWAPEEDLEPYPHTPQE